MLLTPIFRVHLLIIKVHLRFYAQDQYNQDFIQKKEILHPPSAETCKFVEEQVKYHTVGLLNNFVFAAHAEVEVFLLLCRGRLDNKLCLCPCPALVPVKTFGDPAWTITHSTTEKTLMQSPNLSTFSHWQIHLWFLISFCFWVPPVTVSWCGCVVGLSLCIGN